MHVRLEEKSLAKFMFYIVYFENKNILKGKRM